MTTEQIKIETAHIACLLAWAEPTTASVAHAGHACSAIGLDYLGMVCAFAGDNVCGVPDARKAVADAVCRAGARTADAAT